MLTSLVVYGLPGFALAQEAPPAAPPPPAAPEATKTEPSWKISGLVYGDYYWLAADHREALEDQNGFWFRRIYLTYDHTFSKAFSARLRLEMNSPGDFSSSERMTPYVKDAWVKWTHGGHAVSFGLAPTPSFEFVESVWGYRSVEKTPLDLLRWDSSRDMGLLAQGALGVARATACRWATAAASTARRIEPRPSALQCDTRSSRASPSRAMPTCRIARAPTGGLPGRSSARSCDRAGRVGAQFSEQHRRSASGGEATLDLVSIFGARKIRDRLFVFGRADHNFDPVPDGETIDYLPMSDQVGNTLWIGGVDVELDRHVFLQPHVEIVDYPTPKTGPVVQTDVMVKATVFVTW